MVVSQPIISQEDFPQSPSSICTKSNASSRHIKKDHSKAAIILEASPRDMHKKAMENISLSERAASYRDLRRASVASSKISAVSHRTSGSNDSSSDSEKSSSSGSSKSSKSQQSACKKVDKGLKKGYECI